MCDFFFYFWYHGDVGLIEWAWVYCFLSIFLTEFWKGRCQYVSKYLIEFACEGIWSWTFVCWEIFNSVSISVFLSCQFLFSFSSCFSLERIYLPKNLSISSMLSILLTFSCLYPFVFLVPVFWWMELALVLLVDQAVSWGVFWYVCEFNTILDRLSTDEWVSVPVLLVIQAEVFSTGACRVLSGTSLKIQGGLLEEFILVNSQRGWEFSGGLVARNWVFHHNGSVLTSNWETKTSAAVQSGQNVKQ